MSGGKTTGDVGGSAGDLGGEAGGEGGGGGVEGGRDGGGKGGEGGGPSGEGGSGGGLLGGGGKLGGLRQSESSKGPLPPRMISSVSALLRVQLRSSGASAEILKSRQLSARQKATSTKSPPLVKSSQVPLGRL